MFSFTEWPWPSPLLFLGHRFLVCKWGVVKGSGGICVSVVNILWTSLCCLHSTLSLIVVKKLKITFPRMLCGWVLDTIQVLLIRSRLKIRSKYGRDYISVSFTCFCRSIFGFIFQLTGCWFWRWQQLLLLGSSLLIAGQQS